MAYLMPLLMKWIRKNALDQMMKKLYNSAFWTGKKFKNKIKSGRSVVFGFTLSGCVNLILQEKALRLNISHLDLRGTVRHFRSKWISLFRLDVVGKSICFLLITVFIYHAPCGFY